MKMFFFRNSRVVVSLLVGIVLLVQGTGSTALAQSKPQKGTPPTESGKKNQRPVPMTEEEKKKAEEELRITKYEWRMTKYELRLTKYDPIIGWRFDRLTRFDRWFDDHCLFFWPLNVNPKGLEIMSYLRHSWTFLLLCITKISVLRSLFDGQLGQFIN